MMMMVMLWRLATPVQTDNGCYFDRLAVPEFVTRLFHGLHPQPD